MMLHLSWSTCLLGLVCFDFVRLDSFDWTPSCKYDCSWRNSDNTLQPCTFKDSRSGERAVCTNIFETGTFKEGPQTSLTVAIKTITTYVVIDGHNECSAGLNISFQLPLFVDKYKYRGVAIEVTSDTTRCYYIDFTTALKLKNLIVPVGDYDVAGMILYFDCIYGLIPETNYNIGISLLSNTTIGRKIEQTYVPSSYSKGDRRCKQELWKTWQPIIKKLVFDFPNASVSFSLGPYAFSSYNVVLQPVSCKENIPCKNTNVGQSVEIHVIGNRTIQVIRTLKGNPNLSLEYANSSSVVLVAIQFHFVEIGEYKVTLTSFSKECSKRIPYQCRNTQWGPETQVNNTATYDVCYYLPCGNATCISNRDSKGFECVCDDDDLMYDDQSGLCIYNICRQFPCQNGLCQPLGPTQRSCSCWSGYFPDVEGHCVENPCQEAWCLKKSIAVITTIVSLIGIILAGVLYKMYINQSSEIHITELPSGSDDQISDEDASDDDELNSVYLHDLKQFNESIEATLFNQSGQSTSSNACSGSYTSSSTQTSCRMAGHCHPECIPLCHIIIKDKV